MARRRIRFPSLMALRKHIANGGHAQNRHRVLNAVADIGKCTRSEISRESGVPINEVAGRVNELIKEGILRDDGPPMKCSVSGNVVHAVELNTSNPLTNL